MNNNEKNLNIIRKNNLNIYNINFFYLSFNRRVNFFYFESDIINIDNLLIKQKKYYANLQISKNLYNRYYFRNFKEFFKLDSFNNFQYRLTYFKFFYF